MTLPALDDPAILERDASIVVTAIRDGLRPDPTVTVSEWADEYRSLSQEEAAEPGRWRTDRTPYLREIMDTLSPASRYREVVVMAGSQLGKTESGNNWVGYVIDRVPGPMLVVQPTVQLGKRWSKQRLSRLVATTPQVASRIASKVSRGRTRTSGDTVETKEFSGGILVVTGANSAAGLCSMPVRYLFLDEVDRYPMDADGEGDPIELAEQRTATFARKKILKTSTPTIDGLSRIQSAYEASDRRRYWVPCTRCGAMQVLRWDRMRWEAGKPKTAVYACGHCDETIENHEKPHMLRHGEWRADNPSERSIAGFWISSLYSPWMTWAEMVRKFERTKGNTLRLKAFVNTGLAETWRELTDAPEWRRIYDRRESYPIGTVPAGVVFLTASVDVQKDRLEYEVRGWGRGKESWSVDYGVIPGDPYKIGVWDALDVLLARDWPTDWGAALPIRVMAVDSGFATKSVYEWAKRHPQPLAGPAGTRATSPRTVMPVRGVDTGVSTFAKVTRTGIRGAFGELQVWNVSTHVLKTELYGLLRLDRPIDGPCPQGYLHFPEYEPNYFEQLTSEKMVIRHERGFPRRVWILADGKRNEALDLAVYNRAAAEAVGIESFGERAWARLEEIAGIVPRAPKPPIEAPGPENFHPAPSSGPVSKSRNSGRKVIRSRYLS